MARTKFVPVGTSKRTASSSPVLTSDVPSPGKLAYDSDLMDGESNVDDDDVAPDESDIPYNIEVRAPHSIYSKPTKPDRTKKRKLSAQHGSFEKNSFDSRLDVDYAVHSIPDEQGTSSPWHELKSYSRVQAESFTISSKDIIYVQPPAHEGTGRVLGPKDNPYDDCWVAQVLEIRSVHTNTQESDHVYLRINWLYRPEDLPQGRLSYHADGEVFPSNHMQIVDAAAICGRVKSIEHLDQNNWHSISGGYVDLFWRYTFDYRSQKVTKPKGICICRKPANPDFGPLRCAGKGCNFLMHPECVEKDMVERLHRRHVLHDPVAEDEGIEPATKPPKSVRGSKKAASVKVKGKTFAPKTSSAAESARHYFTVSLVVPQAKKSSSARLMAKVNCQLPIVAGDGKTLDDCFESEARCLKCRAYLLQQKGHALLDPEEFAQQHEQRPIA